MISSAGIQSWFILCTHRAVTTLLTQVTFPGLALDLLSLLELANARVQALRHVVVGRILWLRNVEKLNGELADAVRRSSNNTTTLALDTADTTVIDGPLVEAGNVDSQRTSISLALIVAETDVGTRKRPILTNQIVQKIPSCGLLVALGCGLGFLLLLKGKTVGFLLSASLLLLTLLGRRKKVAECRARCFLGDSLGRCGREHFWLAYWRLKLCLQGELELEIVQNNELEFLSDRGGMPKLQP